MFKQGILLIMLAVSRSNQSLSYPRQGVIRVQDLGPVESFVCEFDVFVMEIKQPQVGPRYEILGTR